RTPPIASPFPYPTLFRSGADRGDAQCRAGAALLRHGVAVDAGHYRGGLARNAHQDRGSRAAVLRAVIDAGEHYDCLGGVEPEGRDRKSTRLNSSHEWISY